MKLYHYSEDPAIAVFHPQIAKTSRIRHEAYVWAIDEWYSPMYYLPRDCPRASFWAGERTTAVDRDRWLHGLEPRFVMAGSLLGSKPIDTPHRIFSARDVVTVHGFSADTLLQALPGLPSSPPLPATVWYGILLGRLDPQSAILSRYAMGQLLPLGSSWRSYPTNPAS
jgi:hypothetical protein